MAPRNTSKQEELRNRICQFRKMHQNSPKSFTVKHFVDEGVPRSTIYKIIDGDTEFLNPKRKQGSGRVPKKMDKKNVSALKKMINHRDGVSQHQLARRFNCSQSFISKTIKRKTSIKYRKKKKIPARTESQKERIKPNCRYLYRNFRHVDFILDDESYFTLGNTQLLGNSGFYSSDVCATPSEVKFKTKKKYEEKVLVYLIISPAGVSKPYIIPSGMAINKQRYKSILETRLLPFIDEHYKNGQYLFWPDLASSHYAKVVTDYLDANNVNYVPKCRNPPNMPEARPIEDFWTELKRAVYQRNWQAKNTDQLQRRIEYCFKNMEPNLAKRYAEQTSVRLSRIAFNDIIEKQ